MHPGPRTLHTADTPSRTPSSHASRPRVNALPAALLRTNHGVSGGQGTPRDYGVGDTRGRENGNASLSFAARMSHLGERNLTIVLCAYRKKNRACSIFSSMSRAVLMQHVDFSTSTLAPCLAHALRKQVCILKRKIELTW